MKVRNHEVLPSEFAGVAVLLYACASAFCSVAVQAPAQWISPANWFNPQTAAIRKPGTTVRIDLIGDSTQTKNAGYGRGFCCGFAEDEVTAEETRNAEGKRLPGKSRRGLGVREGVVLGPLGLCR